jgi:TRAP-type C4-dicarboxylate transport system permease small subunit
MSAGAALDTRKKGLGGLALLARLIERTCEWGVYAGGAMLVLAAFCIAADILGRQVFHVTVGGADELSSYALAIGSSWAFGFTLLRRGHIRIDALYKLLPERAKVVLDVLALASLAAFILMLLWQSSDLLLYSMRFRTRSNTPLLTPMWIPIGLWVLGLILFLLTTVLQIVRVLAALSRGQFARTRELAGAADVEEELAELERAAVISRSEGKG